MKRVSEYLMNHSHVVYKTGSAYIITKPSNQFSSHLTFSTPVELQAADRVNFRSKSTNASVTRAVTSLIIE